MFGDANITTGFSRILVGKFYMRQKSAVDQLFLPQYTVNFSLKLEFFSIEIFLADVIPGNLLL
jgi:hypothetical protein